MKNTELDDQKFITSAEAAIVCVAELVSKAQIRLSSASHDASVAISNELNKSSMSDIDKSFIDDIIARIYNIRSKCLHLIGVANSIKEERRDYAGSYHIIHAYCEVLKLYHEMRTEDDAMIEAMEFHEKS